MSKTDAAPFQEIMRSWMHEALREARIALDAGEAPIGALILNGTGDVIGRGHNTMLAGANPTLHAEINAFASAAGSLAEARDLFMVSTLEPCVMCTGAAMQAGVATIVYALKAPADSGTGRVSPPTAPDTTHPVVVGGIGAAESRALFVAWMDRHEGDDTRNAQREFIAQLLTLTAGDSEGAATGNPATVPFVN
jgi:tRNA(adenine34) deaminase